MRNIRTRAMVLTMAVGALALSACGPKDNAATNDKVTAPNASAAASDLKGEIVVQTWALTPKFTPFLDGVIKGFNAKYPNVKVKIQDQPGDGYDKKLLSQASTNSLPDVINLPPDFALPLAKQGMLLDISAADQSLSSTYVKSSLEGYIFRGITGVYAYPWYLNTDVAYFNAEKLDANGLDSKNPPKTTQELLTQAATMSTKSGGKEYLISSKPQLGEIANAGVKLLSEDGKKAVFNTPEAVALLEKYKDAYQKGYMPKAVLNDDYLGNSALFKKSEVAYTTGGGNFLADVLKDNPTLKGKVVVGPALDTPPVYIQGVAVAKNSKNPQAAIAFAQWITNADNQRDFAKLVNIFPSTTASSSDPFFTKDDGTDVGKARLLAFQSLERSKVLIPTELTGSVENLFKQQVSLCLKGDISCKDALDKAVDKINDQLARN